MRSSAVILLLALALLLPPSASAAIARAVDFDEKVAQADAIILGRCIHTESSWDPSGRWIVTRSTFSVEKQFKGAAAPTVTVITPGGTVGSIRQETIGVPRFEEGEVSVVFVRRSRLGATVLYLDQGVYRVDESAGDRIVAPKATNLVLVDMQSGTAVERDESPRSLAVFEREVRDRVTRNARRAQ